MQSSFLSRNFTIIVLISIVIISAAMHAPHFSKDLMGLHVWRQTQTQSTINNFYVEDMNIFNPRRNDRGSGDGIFRMEFPLAQWLVAATYKLFGPHVFISRIWMFVIGIFSVFGIFKLLKTLTNNDIPALMGAWAFNFSPGFYYHTINPMPDNLALCLGIWGLAAFFFWLRNEKIYSLLLSGLLLSLSALVKLPFILYFSVPLGCMLLASGRKPQAASRKIQISNFKFPVSFLKAAGYSLFAFPALAWYIAVVPQWEGNGIVQGVFGIKGSGAVVRDHFVHHLFITLPDLLLNYGSVPFFIAAIYFISKRKEFRHRAFLPFALLGILLLLYILFELNMIGKSHDYYFFPFYPLLFILVGYGAYQLYLLKPVYVRTLVVALLLVLPLTAFLRVSHRWNPGKPGFNKDLLVYKDELRNAVPNDVLCVAGNDYSHFIFFYYIDKKGWGFHYDELNDNQLSEMIKQGAKYLYSDSRQVEEKPGIPALLDDLVMERGSVRIYRLKHPMEVPTDP